MSEALNHNATALEQELDWLLQLIDTRFKLYFGHETPHQSIVDITPPDLAQQQSLYADFVNHYQMSFSERVILLLALTPHIRPQILDVFFAQNKTYNRGFSEFGGIRGQQHGGFLPTGETAAFLLSGSELQGRFSLHQVFDGDHFFARHNILKLEPPTQEEPFLSGALRLMPEFLDYFTIGTVRKPDYSYNFPAKRLTTGMGWDDLVLESSTLRQLEEIKAWISYGQQLMDDWNLKAKIRPGYRSLFYGPPGTGKTLTASLLGQTTGKDVYRIDLSMVVSKYIGETEKNLSKIFDQGENKNWILFFDEADALFGKRTKVEDAHDKHANQEVAYLLQRMESFNGIILLASNLKGNLDEAFTRRFESIINFPMPDSEARLQLWQKGFSEQSTLEDKINLKQIAKAHELAGGSIMNVVRYASLMALSHNRQLITLTDLEEGIRKEFQKEGKTL